MFRPVSGVKKDLFLTIEVSVLSLLSKYSLSLSGVGVNLRPFNKTLFSVLLSFRSERL